MALGRKILAVFTVVYFFSTTLARQVFFSENRLFSKNTSSSNTKQASKKKTWKTAELEHQAGKGAILGVRATVEKRVT